LAVPLRTALLVPGLALLASGCGHRPAPVDLDLDAAPPAASSAIVAIATIPDAGPEDAGAVDASASATATEDAGPRIGSIGRTTWIYATSARKERLGYLRPGTSARLLATPTPELGHDHDHDHDPHSKKRAKAPTPKGDCKSGRWYAVEPEGFVCGDETTTLDLTIPLYRALAFAGPRPSAVPFGYAFSTRAPMYGKLPTPKEERRAERRLRPVSELFEVRRSTAGHEDLAVLDPPTPIDPVPDFLADGAAAPVPVGQQKGLVRKQIPYGSMLAFQQVFTFGGRTFLLTPDLTAVPADRMRIFHPSTFHGTPIDAAHPLPIGWFRREPRAKFRRAEAGALVATGATWAPRTFVGLTGATVDEGGVTYRETRDEGLFARDVDLSIVDATPATPKGVAPGEKWIDVGLAKGTLTLFEGTTAVYSTLMSPGAGGTTPSPDLRVDELVRAALTPLGTYRIAVKHRAAQMTSEDKPDPDAFWIADVPHAQYFRAPFAIHAAYWHEDFGSPKSGGCVNLSPADAERVFDWTEPALPAAWTGVIARKSKLGTVLVIHR
jgi:hypothetical protein